MRRTRAAASLIGAALIAALALAPPADGAAAAWGTTEQASGSLGAGTVSPPTNLSCTAGLLQPVTFSWTAPTGGLALTDYQWTVSGGLSGSGTLAADATSVTLSTGLLGLGSGTFRLVARGPGGWESTATTGSLTFATVVLNVLSSCST